MTRRTDRMERAGWTPDADRVASHRVRCSECSERVPRRDTRGSPAVCLWCEQGIEKR